MREDGTTGHIWANGAIREGLHRLPTWWIVMSGCLFLASFTYLAPYPGFGANRGGLATLLLARRLAVRAVRILSQNRRWALAWNLAAVPFAAMRLVPPWLTAVGMSASSLAVVLNTLRVRVATAPVSRAAMWRRQPARTRC